MGSLRCKRLKGRCGRNGCRRLVSRHWVAEMAGSEEEVLMTLLTWPEPREEGEQEKDGRGDILKAKGRGHEVNRVGIEKERKKMTFEGM